ncbi:nuclear transport factor 2 family protein [Gramella sp. MT6]|uniref:nuclear transport factor 2 family protein n=1 Tax=Gramella sp. MT6 TaxID=2705471 RepID=UPI001C5D79C3|nr:nuclear transport factor 2 family protein [Gramella sp. MT6]QYA25082.1 nuclear transport factor 2 family protein [Gramella sp. MT6]
MNRSTILSVFALLLFSLSGMHAQVKNTEQNINAVKKKVTKTVDKWHEAAAKVDFEDYFDLMTNDAIFIGTDATENWNLPEFKKFSKPYFDAGKAWSFTPVERNIYVHENLRVAWFDELLDTHMGICRGSGVLTKENSKWKISHYVLSIAIPNDNVDEITEIKAAFDKDLIQKLKNN